ncbi:MAG: hypothetical protein IPG69_21470 [Flavobacteriales bacterium]|nr:hypothetical protein [Flavobacteriales bacterium]
MRAGEVLDRFSGEESVGHGQFGCPAKMRFCHHTHNVVTAINPVRFDLCWRRMRFDDNQILRSFSAGKECSFR